MEKRFQDRLNRQFIDSTQHPLRLQKDRFGNEDIFLSCKNSERSPCLERIVISYVTHQDIRIDSDHRFTPFSHFRFRSSRMPCSISARVLAGPL